MKNNNQKIIRKLTIRSLAADKKRNFFVIAAIALTTFMITFVFSIGLSLLHSVKRQQICLSGSAAHAAISQISPKQAAKLNELAYIKAIGKGCHVAAAEKGTERKDITLSLYYLDETAWKDMYSPAYDDVTGSYPKQADEVMLPKWVLEQFGNEKPKLGIKIPISYLVANNGKQITYKENFVLSGYFTNYTYSRAGFTDSIYVSKAFADKYNKTIEKDGFISVQFKDTSHLLRYCSKLKEDLLLSEEQTVIPSPIYDIKEAENTGIIVILLIALLILFVGYLLIYNVFNISVTRDIRLYGMLKTLGTTPGQIRSIVLRQVLCFCTIGITAGFLLASFVLSLAAPAIIEELINLEIKVTISFAPLLYTAAALLATATSIIGASKAMKKAADISPVEALNFQDVDVNKTGLPGSAVHARPYKMALRNIFRNRKRAIIVLLGLFLGMTLFMLLTILISSMSIDNYITSFMQSDFILKNTTANFTGENVPKQKFDEDFLQSVEILPGYQNMELNAIDTISLTYGDIYLKHLNENFKELAKDGVFEDSDTIDRLKQNGIRSYIYGIDKKELLEYNKTLENPFDLDAFANGDYVLIAANTPELYDEIDTIEVGALQSIDKFTLKLGGFVPLNPKKTASNIGPTIICSYSLLKKITENPIVSSISIHMAKGYDLPAYEKLKTMTAGDSEVSFLSRIDTRKNMENLQTVFYALGDGIALILGLIGLMNFINAMSVGIIVRRRELAILESVGMEKRQMRQMLVCEGLWYGVITFVLVNTLGNLITYGVFQVFQKQISYAVYTYPALPLLIVWGIIFGICILTPLLAYGSMNKMTLVERLREAEGILK